MIKETVMLVLGRKVIAKLMIEHMRNVTHKEVFGVYEFNKVKNMALAHRPVFALVEIPERYGDPALDTLDVCGDIKEASPNCNIVLLCPEQDKKSVDICIEAKITGKIEDYIFYEASLEYLTSKVKTLLPA